MRKIAFALFVTVIIVAVAHAYNGRATVTKSSEAKHGVQFAVTFQEHDGMLLVSVVAPQKVKTLPLSGFTVVQIDKDKTTLRVPMSTAAWTFVSDKNGRFKLVPGQLEPKVTFAVTQARLPYTRLEVQYGGGESAWAYVIDLASYQTEKDRAQPGAPADADKRRR